VYRTKLPDKQTDLESLPEVDMAAVAPEPEPDLVSV
jgi:hypothetical protein